MFFFATHIWKIWGLRFAQEDLLSSDILRVWDVSVLMEVPGVKRGKLSLNFYMISYLLAIYPQLSLDSEFNHLRELFEILTLYLLFDTERYQIFLDWRSELSMDFLLKLYLYLSVTHANLTNFYFQIWHSACGCANALVKGT